jgi:hypothetical protein
MKKKHKNLILPLFIGGALGAISWFAYQKAKAQPASAIIDPWAGPTANQSTLTPMAGLGFVGVGCGCSTPIRGY